MSMIRKESILRLLLIKKNDFWLAAKKLKAGQKKAPKFRGFFWNECLVLAKHSSINYNE